MKPPQLIAFAVKSNPNLAVLKVLQREGFGRRCGVGGEMARALAAGMRPPMIVFSGVGKTAAEMAPRSTKASASSTSRARKKGSSWREIAAREGHDARCALRVNPDVDAGTHEKISTGKADNKFGVPIDRRGRSSASWRSACRPGDLRGLAVHIGSQLADLRPLEPRSRSWARWCAAAHGGSVITHVDLGGGLGVPYRAGECCPVRPNTARWSARHPRLGREADVRAGPRDRRQCRRAADPRDPGEARARTACLRDRRCRDERSGAPCAL
jgi:diaminopimelate decarboxylase